MGGNSTVEATGSPSAPDPATNLFTDSLTIVVATGESARSTSYSQELWIARG
jgi:hypothetical protein